MEVGMKQQSCWGVLWISKRSQVSPLENAKKRQHDIWCLIINILANRVVIVSFVITRYSTLSSTSQSIFPQGLFMFSASVFDQYCCHFVYCFYALLFDISCFRTCIHLFLLDYPDSVSVLFKLICSIVIADVGQTDSVSRIVTWLVRRWTGFRAPLGITLLCTAQNTPINKGN
jgi:hypothetical protein